MTQLIDLGKLRFYWADSFNSSVEYELNDVVKYGGNVYVYTNALATTGNLPTNTIYWKSMVEGINFLGTFSTGTAYKPGDAVTHGANLYLCENPATGFTPPNATYWSLIAAGIQYEGAYNSGTQYQKDDIVSYGGSTYIALRDTIADQPDTSASDWAKLVDGTYPDQDGKNNYILKTDGTEAVWTNSPSLDSVAVAEDLSVDGIVYSGANAASFNTSADLTGPVAVFDMDSSPYGQVAVHNQNTTASTDIIAYASNGDDTSGWIDMGVTGEDFSQAEFGITGPNDGYIFFEAPEGTTGEGNLVFATGANGTDNKIIFAAGGFESGLTQMSITPDENVHIEIDTPSTSATTGALTIVGGVGISGDMNIAGAVNIVGDLTFGGGSTTTENLTVTDPLVFVGDGNAGDAIDLGIVGEYTSGGNTKYAGVVRDASDGAIKFFTDATTKPVSTVNFSEAGLVYADIKVDDIEADQVTTSGNLTVATDKLVVNASTGAITAAGTFSASGLATLNGGITSSGAVTLSGGASFSGTVDVQELREQVVDVTLSSNAATLDWSAGNIYYIGTAPTGNMTFNATNVPTDNSKIMTINVFVVQGSTGYVPGTFQIGGTSQTIRWAGGSAPTPTSSAGKIDVFSFTLQRTSAGSWIVYGAATLNF